MALFQCIDGRESFTDPDGSINIRAFIFVDGRERLLSEMIAHMRAVPNTITCTAYESFNACTTNINHGVWRRAVLQASTPEYMSIVVSKRRQGDKLPVSRVMYLEIDNNAPYNKLELPLTGHPKATLKSALFEGRFALLTDDEIKRVIGKVEGAHSITERIKHTTNILSDSAIPYTLTQEEAGKKVVVDAVKTIETKSGHSVNVVTTRARRIKIV